MSIIPEILAPAGGMPQLEAAVRSGADAVYLGAQTMNARASAANFDDGQLARAVSFCHVRGVKVYLTMNTLLFDDELADAEKLLSLACGLGIDALIVQDLGLASYISARAPAMRLHASTQCSVQTVSGVRMLRELGFCRAILARELSRGELEQLAAADIMELEYFVHGALCMSVSGQCWLSAMLGQRSGNRGRCAQPCRLPFRDGSFSGCLSLKDSSLIPHIPGLARMGIASLKIEGRLKRPEYVAAVTDACVRRRDGKAFSDGDMQRLAAVFSRSGFTDGYFKGLSGGTGGARCGRRDMFGTRTKADVEAADSATLASIHALYKNERSRVPVSVELRCSADSAELAVSDGEGNTAVSRAALGASAQTIGGENALSASARSKLGRTGGTPYFVSGLNVSGEGLNRLTPSAAGELRRQALDRLSELRGRARSIPMTGTAADGTYSPLPLMRQSLTRQSLTRQSHMEQSRMEKSHARQYAPRLDLVFRSEEQIPGSFPQDGALAPGRAYLPLEMPSDSYTRAAAKLKKAGFEPALECARGMFGLDDRIAGLLEEKKKLGAGLCMAHNLGAVRLILDAGLECCGGFGLNIANALSLGVMERLGLKDAELSVELTAARIRALGGELPRSAIIYGYLPLMLTRTCPASLEKGCRGLSAGSGGEYCRIHDRMGKAFPVICREGCSELLNSLPLSMSDRLNELPSVERFTARFTIESSGEAERVIGMVMSGQPLTDAPGVTRGLYYRGVY